MLVSWKVKTLFYLSDHNKHHKSAVIQGWGYVDSDRENNARFPQQTVLSVLTQEQCGQSKIANKLKEVKNIEQMVICAYKANSDACQVGINHVNNN